MLECSPAALVARADAAIVDLDGTMVDTLGDFAEALRRMLGDLSLPGIDAAEIERMVGRGTEHLLRSVLDHVLQPMEPQRRAAAVEAHYPQAWEAYGRHYLAINGSHSRVYEGRGRGAAGPCAPRGCGWPASPTSLGPSPCPLLRAKGLDGFFDHVFGGDAFERKKPHPLPLLKACEALGNGARPDPGHRGLRQRCARGPRRRLPRGAGDLWLQPRPARAAGGRGRARGQPAVAVRGLRPCRGGPAFSRPCRAARP